MRFWVHAAVAVTASCILAAAATAEAPKSKNYVLFPIKTDLQRALLFSTRADAYAQFDVAEMVTEGKLDMSRIDGESLAKELAALAHGIGKPKPNLQLYFRYAGVALDPEPTKTMEDAITAVCRVAGFAKVGQGTTGEGGTWQDKVAKFAGLEEDGDAMESPIEDEFLRAYPVRTRLSRFLLGDVEYDCVLELRQSIDGRFKKLSVVPRQLINQRVTELKLPQKRMLTFRCMTTRAGRKTAEEYFTSRGNKPALVDAFVKELGFQRSTYGSTPMSVSPEDLIGKQAPDFTLDGLTGGQIHLQELIHGRVGVIAFWGVACGACRVEAPHLTELANRYGSKGLSVIAVNGYNEQKEDVERFAREKGLTHSIALMGRAVAEKKYTVASYPVTYLIDRTGAIVDYHLGFEPGDEKRLAEVVVRLLADGGKADDLK